MIRFNASVVGADARPDPKATQASSCADRIPTRYLEYRFGEDYALAR